MIDPSYIDQDALQQDIDFADAEEQRRAAALLEEQRIKEQQEKEAAKEGQSGIDQFKDAVGKATDIGKDVYKSYLNNPLNVGMARGLNGIFTMPERMFDLATGEVAKQEEGGGEYSPDWDPFKSYIDENKPKNWWESGTQIAFETATQVGAAAVASPSSLVGRLTVGAPLEALMSSDVGTNKQKLLISDSVPWLKDQFNDSPISKTMKAVLENMAFEGTGELIGALWGKAFREVDADSIEIQRVEKAKVEYDEDMARYRTGYQLEGQRGLPEGIDKVEVRDITDEVAEGAQETAEGTFRAAKNPDLADPGQGGINSRSSTDVQFSNRKWQINDAEDLGTIGYNFTPAQAERMSTQNGIDAEWMDAKAQELYTSAYYQDVVGRTKASKNQWYEANKEIFAEFQQQLGRYDASVDPEDFWKAQFERQAFTGGSRP